MPNKCYIPGCKSGYETRAYNSRISFYKFPKDETERERWRLALPYMVDKSDISEQTYICSKHWPQNFPMHKPFRLPISVPMNPPSLYDNVLPTNFIITSRGTKKRKVEERNILFESRSVFPDPLDEFNKIDIIHHDYSTLQHDMQIYANQSDIDIHIFNNMPNQIVIAEYHDPWNIHWSISIHSNFSIVAMVGKSKVSIRDILGYQHKLQRWSQLDNIIARLRNSDIDPILALSDTLADTARSLKNYVTDEKINFLLDQIIMLHISPNGRRHTIQIIIQAIRFFLSSRSCYKQLKPMLSLPSVIVCINKCCYFCYRMLKKNI